MTMRDTVAPGVAAVASTINGAADRLAAATASTEGLDRLNASLDAASRALDAAVSNAAADRIVNRITAALAADEASAAAARSREADRQKEIAAAAKKFFGRR